jgi:hypothetical protein
VRLKALEHLSFDIFDVGELAPTSDIAVSAGASISTMNHQPRLVSVFFPFPGFPSVFLGSSDYAPGRPSLFASFTSTSTVPETA